MSVLPCSYDLGLATLAGIYRLDDINILCARPAMAAWNLGCGRDIDAQADTPDDRARSSEIRRQDEKLNRVLWVRTGAETIRDASGAECG